VYVEGKEEKKKNLRKGREEIGRNVFAGRSKV
jgi:hypothetical protein